MSSYILTFHSAACSEEVISAKETLELTYLLNQPIDIHCWTINLSESAPPHMPSSITRYQRYFSGYGSSGQEVVRRCAYRYVVFTPEHVCPHDRWFCDRYAPPIATSAC